jgi:hypothetical protein
MELNNDDFMYASINPYTGERVFLHLIDIVDEVCKGTISDIKIKWPEEVLDRKTYEKYAFLIHCIAVRKKEMEKYKQNTDWEDLLADLAKGW